MGDCTYLKMILTVKGFRYLLDGECAEAWRLVVDGLGQQPVFFKPRERCVFVGVCHLWKNKKHSIILFSCSFSVFRDKCEIEQEWNFWFYLYKWCKITNAFSMRQSTSIDASGGSSQIDAECSKNILKLLFMSLKKDRNSSELKTSNLFSISRQK